MKVIRAFCLSVVIASAGLSSVQAEVILSKLFTITKPIGGREFLNPQSVCIDAVRGDVYVTDTGNGRIEVLTKDGYKAGGFQHRTDTDGEGSSEPIGIAIDNKANIYITDSFSSRISIYDFKGRLKQRINLPLNNDQQPVLGRMTVDNAGNIYVAVRNIGTIYVFDPKGTPKMKVGSKGTGKGQFTMLSDVAVDSKGRVYALDTQGTPVQVFDSSGRYLFGFGEHAMGSGNFAHPTSIEVDEIGNIWTVDSFAQRVSVFNSQGKFQREFIGFYFPVDLAYSARTQRMYVLEKTGHRLIGFEVKRSSEQ